MVLGTINCKVKIRGLKASDEFEALLDTGSTYSHLDKNIADKVGAMMTGYNVKSKIANGTMVEEPLAVAFATLDGCDRPILATVTEKGAAPVIIGAQAMQLMGISLDPEHESYLVRCPITKA